jgi:Transglutaminase-like superfamily
MTRWWIRVLGAASFVVLCLGVRPTSMAQARVVGAKGHTVSRSLSSGTLVLRGNLTSVVEINLKGAFSVGNAQNLHWDLPRMTSVHENGYTEQLDALTYTFDVQPDSFSDTEVDGHAVRQFVWQSPPASTVIHVTEKFRATVRSDLSPFISSAAYPLKQVSDEAASYLTVTPLVKLPAGVQPLLDSFKAGKRSEQSVVASVINWVAAHTTYDGRMKGSRVSAKNVLESHRAICRGYVNLATGILRALGIPVRTEFGWVSSGQLNLPGPHHGSSYIQWAVPGTAGELHTWLSVYFPDAGWVPMDPQREKFFVDSHHFAFFSNLDAGSPVTGAWSADYYGDASPTGAALPNGEVEIVPGDGISSTVTVHTTDSVHATLQGFEHDVQGVLLFSR